MTGIESYKCIKKSFWTFLKQQRLFFRITAAILDSDIRGPIQFNSIQEIEVILPKIDPSLEADYGKVCGWVENVINYMNRGGLAVLKTSFGFLPTPADNFVYRF